MGQLVLFTGVVPQVRAAYGVPLPASCNLPGVNAASRRERRSTRRASGGDAPSAEEARGGELAKTILILSAVPLSWSTYTVLVRFLFGNIEPAPPSSVLNVLNYIVSCTALRLVVLRQDRQAARGRSPADEVPTSSVPGAEPSNQNLLYAGGELGLYLFLGSTMQLIGLESIGAARGSFLVQSTTAMVPLMEALGGIASRRNWTAVQSGARKLGSSFLAIAGVAVVSVFGSGTEGSVGGAGLSAGDLWTLAAAVFYSAHVLRLGYWAGRVPRATSLAAAKSQTQLVLSLGYAAWCLSGTDELQRFAAGLDATEAAQLAAGAVWLGAGTTALPQWAQSFGQRRASPTLASILYSAQPVWAAALAWAVLGEPLTPWEFLGGALIAAGAAATRG